MRVITLGNNTSIQLPDQDPLDILDEQCNFIVSQIDQELARRWNAFSDNNIKSIYIDPLAKTINIPNGQRGKSNNINTFAIGSRIPYSPDKKYIRPFVFWKNNIPSSAIDLDLSVVFYDNNMNQLSQCSYTNLRNSYAVHSGDIVNAPEGASEYINIDIQKAKKYGVRYVQLNVFSYSPQTFTEIKECFIGWMFRENMSGEIFEPSTVDQKFDLNSDSRRIIACIFDLKQNEMIWVDQSTGNCKQIGSNDVHNEMIVFRQNPILRNIIFGSRMSLDELFKLHIQDTSIQLVDDPQDADYVISGDDSGDLSLFDYYKIASTFLK
jgi:stress response protein SCP2